LYPGSLETISAVFSAHPDVDVLYSHGVVIDEHEREVALMLLPRHSDRALRLYNFIPQPTCAWRRSIWEKVGGLNDSLQYAMDWDLWTRFLDAGARFLRLPTCLAAFRIHPLQKTRVGRRLGARENAEIRRRAAHRDLSFPEVVVRALPHVLRRMGLTASHRLGLARLPAPAPAGERPAPASM
jgi:hypothetical protein